MLTRAVHAVRTVTLALILVHNETDVFDKDRSFHPHMSHQVFGDGYENVELHFV